MPGVRVFVFAVRISVTVALHGVLGPDTVAVGRHRLVPVTGRGCGWIDTVPCVYVTDITAVVVLAVIVVVPLCRLFTVPVRRFVVIGAEIVWTSNRHVNVIGLYAVESRRARSTEYWRCSQRLGLIHKLHVGKFVNGFFDDLVNRFRVMQFFDVHWNRYNHSIASENKKIKLKYSEFNLLTTMYTNISE